MSKSYKRILIDTTYLLPTMSFSVKGIPDDIILRLIGHNYLIIISSISLFEMIAVGSKYVYKGKLSKADIMNGIATIKYSPDLTIVDYTDEKVMQKAIELNRFLPDFIDCIIVATAQIYSDILLTEDNQRIIPFLRPQHKKPIFPCMRCKELNL